MEGDLTLDGEHTIQYTDDVLQICRPGLHNFINQCHPNKLNQKRQNFGKDFLIGLVDKE